MNKMNRMGLMAVGAKHEAETRQKWCNFVSRFGCHCILHAQRDLTRFADFAAQQRPSLSRAASW
jgi:hypothetical protein